MNTRNLGIGLIILGIVMTVYTGFNYVTTEKVAEIGPIKINAEKNHPVQWTPIIGVLILVGGVIIVASSRRKNN
jgi:uncharacterized membrane protein YidH (DUF202 family)